jgi:hypothetical protein
MSGHAHADAERLNINRAGRLGRIMLALARSHQAFDPEAEDHGIMTAVSTRTASFGLCAIIVSSFACHESTAPPSPYAGGYQLVSVGGTPVPAPWNGTTVMCSTITLGNDGSYTRSVTDTVYSGGSAQLTTTVQTGRWSVSGFKKDDPTLAATLNVTLSDGTSVSQQITKFGIDYSFPSGDWLYSRSAVC